MMTIRSERTAVCAIAKNEDKYLLEWASYHLAIGFDHIFIYDNMSDKKLERIFNARALAEEVSVFLWPSFHARNAQTEAYSHFLRSYGQEFDWIALIDIDEMINIKKDYSVREFLARFNDADSIAINWRIFGSAGEMAYRPDPVMMRFTRASAIDFGPNGLIKSIVRPQRVLHPHVHHAELISESAKVVAADGTEISNTDFVAPRPENYDLAQINHYFSKSYQEWGWKRERGYTDGTVRDPEIFRDFDRNECDDRSILRFYDATTRYMKRIGARGSSRLEYFIRRKTGAF